MLKCCYCIICHKLGLALVTLVHKLRRLIPIYIALYVVVSRGHTATEQQRKRTANAECTVTLCCSVTYSTQACCTCEPAESTQPTAIYILHRYSRTGLHWLVLYVGMRLHMSQLVCSLILVIHRLVQNTGAFCCMSYRCIVLNSLGVSKHRLVHIGLLNCVQWLLQLQKLAYLLELLFRYSL